MPIKDVPNCVYTGNACPCMHLYGDIDNDHTYPFGVLTEEESDQKYAKIEFEGYVRALQAEMLNTVKSADFDSFKEETSSYISTINVNLSRKTDKTDFEAFKSKTESDIETLYSDADTKATKTELEELGNRKSDKTEVENLASVVETKANDAELKELEQVVKKKISYFDNVDALKRSEISTGEYAVTKGYYAVNDNGGGEYFISSTAPETGHFETLNNGLFAVLKETDIINLNAYGCTSETDISPVLQSVFDRVKAEHIKEIHLYGVECSSFTQVNMHDLNSLRTGLIVDFHNSIIKGNGNVFIDANVDKLFRHIIFRNANLENFSTCFVAYNFNYGCILENFETRNCNAFIEAVNCYFLNIRNIRPQNADDFYSEKAWFDFLGGSNLIRLEQIYVDGGFKSYPYCIKVRDAEAFYIDSCSIGNTRTDGIAGLFIESVKCIQISNSYFEGKKTAIYVNGANNTVIINNCFINAMDNGYIFDVSHGAISDLHMEGNYVYAGTIFTNVNNNCFGEIKYNTNDLTQGYDIQSFIKRHNIPKGVVFRRTGYIHTDAGLSGITALSNASLIHSIRTVGSFGDNSTKECGGKITRNAAEGTITIETNIVFQNTQLLFVNFKWRDNDYDYQKIGFICGDRFFNTFSSTAQPSGIDELAERTNVGEVLVEKAESGYMKITLKGASQIEQFIETAYYQLLG